MKTQIKSNTQIKNIWIVVTIGLMICQLQAKAGNTTKSTDVVPEWYFSYGYSRAFWEPSDIHVTQTSLGNNFTVHNVQAEDFPEWNTGVFNKDPTEPQYNIRIGRFLSVDPSIGIEFNYDHSKYTSNIGQVAHITGLIDNKYVDMNQKLTANYFSYNLHNGANHMMMNLVKRISFFKKTNETFNLTGMFRGGAGIMLPHSENTIFGNHNSVGAKSWDNALGMGSGTGWWQLNGFTVGIEAGFRFMFLNPFYVELTDKEAYAYLFDVPVYKGTAEQTLLMNEIILTVGMAISDY